MRLATQRAVLAALAGFALLHAPAVRADEETVPSFKTEKDRETKEFVTRVGTAVVRAARSKPQKIELDRYEYTKPKVGRTELKMKVIYHGLITKKKYTADVVVKIDSMDKDRWEVLNVTYKDNNPSPAKPNADAIQKLIPRFNK